MDNRSSMDTPDKIFTRAIVGSGLSATLGRRKGGPQSAAGLASKAGDRVARAWDDFVILHRPDEALNRPRRQPGALRRWMERQAMALAVLGLAALGAAVALAWVGSWQ